MSIPHFHYGPYYRRTPILHQGSDLRRAGLATGRVRANLFAFPCRLGAATGGIPIGFKLSAQHVEDDLDAALRVGVDWDRYRSKIAAKERSGKYP